MSEQIIKESEQRQLNLQLEYINYTTEEILKNKLNAKKRKSSMVAARRAVVDQVQEGDAIYVSGLDKSIGSFIKNRALEKYVDINSHGIQQQTMISLGMNSILDLSYAFEGGQSTLFSQEQWHELQARFPAVEHEYTELSGNLLSVTTRYTLVLQQLSKARSGLEKKLKSLSKWIKDQEKAADMNEDEQFFLYFVSHIIKCHQKSAYLFDSVTECSEWDYVVKLWSPLIEELFDGVNNLRTKWGDTVFELANEDGTADPKIDIQVILDKAIQMRNVSSGKFSKHNPGNLKYQADKCKVMIEGKNIINQLVFHGVDICNIPVLQICGSELHMLEVSLVAPGLYVGNKRYSFSLVNTWENFEILPELIEGLLEFKNECVEVGELLKDHLITIEYKKGSTTGPKYKKSSSHMVNNKKRWLRDNWIVFRDQKYKTSTIPPPPF
ncbi:hypothetical protein BD408DRAFT_369586, partial [Parasitella parasitica]